MEYSKGGLMSIVLAIFIVIFLFSGYSKVNAASFSYHLDGLVIEGAAVNTDMSSKGPTKAIDFVNPAFGTAVTIKNSISIFTPGNRVWVSASSVKTNVAVVVDSRMIVTQVINKAPAVGVKPAFNESTDVTVPEGGFVLLACDDSYMNAGYKRFLAENFKVGDVVKLKQNDELISVSKIISLTGQDTPKAATLTLDYSQMYTTSDKFATVKGTVYNMNTSNTYSINIKKIDTNGEPINTPDAQGYFIKVDASGVFNTQIPLESGVNYLDVSIAENGNLIQDTTQSMIIFQKDQITADKDKEVVMWVDQYANAKVLNTNEKIIKIVSIAKKAGVTSFAIDVKGPEGYVSYKKNSKSDSPYITETTNPNKKVEMDIDLLKRFIKEAHDLDLKVYASFNFFTEGNLKTNDSAVISQHPDWEEVLQAPEDKGQLKKVSESKRDSTLLYVNPANDEVRKFELSRVEEVLKNYKVDGIIMDRARYDHQYADFSDITKAKFAEYLRQRGKTLNQWPQNAFSIDASGNMVKGVYYYDWLTFRSSIIKSFTEELRTLIDEYKQKENRNFKLAAYVGSWYESYYQVGVNWADDSFQYNKRLGFPEQELYTPEYAKTSYLNYLDFIMIGTYYKTEQQISKYATMGNILTNGQTPICASIDITTSTVTPEEQRVGFQAAYGNTDGCMIFDMCYVNWYAIQCAVHNIKYENPYAIGFSTKNPNTFILGSNMNTPRTEDMIIVYDNGYGDSTGTNQYGVEVVVGADNVVTAVKNKTQAINWNWAAPEMNNSPIPEKGFVISAIDRSGSRVYRQLLANGYSVGDSVYAAVMTDFVNYKTEVYKSNSVNLTFTVNKIGGGRTVKVVVNGHEANLEDVSKGKYGIPVSLSNGNNIFKVEVLIDGYKVLEKQVILTAEL